MKNPFGKTVKRENAYAVYRYGEGSSAWTWYVLKLHQHPAAAAKNTYARAFCLVTSPMVGESGELGDVYLHEIEGVLISGVDVRSGKVE